MASITNLQTGDWQVALIVAAHNAARECASQGSGMRSAYTTEFARIYQAMYAAVQGGTAPAEADQEANTLAAGLPFEPDKGPRPNPIRALRKWTSAASPVRSARRLNRLRLARSRPSREGRQTGAASQNASDHHDHEPLIERR